jgi:t-SNARE complex subunit (syntaxin)
MYLCSKLDNIKSNRTKLNLDIVKQIRKDSCSGLSPAVLSEKYKTSKQNISLIINNLTWVDENYKPKRVK